MFVSDYKIVDGSFKWYGYSSYSRMDTTPGYVYQYIVTIEDENGGLTEERLNLGDVGEERSKWKAWRRSNKNRNEMKIFKDLERAKEWIENYSYDCLDDIFAEDFLQEIERR